MNAIETSNDPMIRLAVAVDSNARFRRKTQETEVDAPLEQAYAELAQERFEEFGMNIYPDATFTLRISYGAVRGYVDDNGNEIAPFTDIAGMFKRAEQHKFKPPFDPFDALFELVHALPVVDQLSVVRRLVTPKPRNRNLQMPKSADDFLVALAGCCLLGLYPAKVLNYDVLNVFVVHYCFLVDF